MSYRETNASTIFTVDLLKTEKDSKLIVVWKAMILGHFTF